MKKSVTVLLLITAAILSVQAQKVSNLTYKLENGIVIRMEKSWGHIWVQQSQAEFKPGEDQKSIEVILRPMGDLVKSGTTVSKLTSGGKEVKMTGAAPGNYNLKVTAGLSGKPGTISFDIDGIMIKAKMKTTVTVTIHDYQFIIEETPLQAKGLASFESSVIKFKGNTDQSPKCGIPAFYPKGTRENPVQPSEKASDLKGKVKPGTYDVSLSLDVCGYTQKLWLENFTLKPDVLYKITTNLNAGEITYGGTVRDVKKLHMYPAGTADKMQGVAKPDKTLERIVFDPASGKFPCPPGQYDVLLNIGNGAKYQWVKNVVIRTGTSTPVK